MASTNVDRLSDSRTEGAWLGNASTEYIGFFGTDTTTQQSAGSTVVLSITGDSAADATALKNAINTTNTALKLYGLLK
jgi:hypothetical protein